MKRILLIHPQSLLLSTMTDYLKDHYRVEAIGRMDHALRILKNQSFDLIVISFDPFDEGFSRIARAASSAAMVCIVEQLVPQTEKVLLEQGIDQFLTFPFELESLKLRIDHLLRKVDLLQVRPLRGYLEKLGPIEIDWHNRKVKNLSGRMVELTPLQAELLRSFFQNQDRLLSRQWLKNHVWKGQGISNRTIDAHVSKLKKTLPDLAPWIVSVYGEGYRFENPKKAA